MYTLDNDNGGTQSKNIVDYIKNYVHFIFKNTIETALEKISNADRTPEETTVNEPYDETNYVVDTDVVDVAIRVAIVSI